MFSWGRYITQGSHGSGKCRGNFYFLKVREKSGNFEIGQGILNLTLSRGTVGEI